MKDYVMLFKRSQNYTQILVFLLISATMSAQSNDSTDLSEMKYGFITINSLPQGLVVLFNNEELGITPLENIKLPAGSQEVIILHPDRKDWKSLDIIKVVNIRNRRTTDLFITMGQSYTIISDPYDAEVFYRGKLLGKTPLHYSHHEPLKGTLSINKEGYKPFLLELRGDERLNTIKASLLKDSDQVAGSPRLFSRFNKPLGRERLYLYSAIGSSIVFGALSVYFNSRADDNYDSYLTNSDASKREFFFRKTEQFDNYSAISLAMSQVTLGVTVYLLLKK